MSNAIHGQKLEQLMAGMQTIIMAKNFIILRDRDIRIGQDEKCEIQSVMGTS